MALLNVTMPSISDKGEWKKRLQLLLHYPSETSIQRFQRDAVYPALQDFGKELDRYGIGYKLTDQIDERGKAGIVVDHGGEMDFIYEVRCRSHVTPLDDISDGGFDGGDDSLYYRAEVHLSEGGQDYDVMGWSKDQLITDVVNQYEQHVHFLQSIRSV
jgi:choline/glycine/proline betaine transport protein